MTEPILVTPQGIATAIQALMDENDELKRKLASADKPDNRPKLTKRDVARIHEMKRNGCTQADIADCLDVNPATVSRIVRGQYHK